MNASNNFIVRDKNMFPNLLHLYKFKVNVETNVNGKDEQYLLKNVFTAAG